MDQLLESPWTTTSPRPPWLSGSDPVSQGPPSSSTSTRSTPECKHAWTAKDPPDRRELLCRTELVASSDRHVSASAGGGLASRTPARNRRASRTWSAVAPKLRDQARGD